MRIDARQAAGDVPAGSRLISGQLDGLGGSDSLTQALAGSSARGEPWAGDETEDNQPGEREHADAIGHDCNPWVVKTTLSSGAKGGTPARRAGVQRQEPQRVYSDADGAESWAWVASGIPAMGAIGCAQEVRRNASNGAPATRIQASRLLGVAP